MFRLLFHGTRKTEPLLIVEGEDGMDSRCSFSGLFGKGCYFADDPGYSHLYAHNIGPVFQMLLCIVSVGRYSEFPKHDERTRSFNKPPLLPGSTNLYFDSCYNKEAKHFITYENNKQYPGYVITYTL